MSNIKLIYPQKKYLYSYLEACKEFKENNVSEGFLDPDKFYIWKYNLFFDFEDTRNGVNLLEGYVPATTFWLIENDEFIGEGTIRHKLNDNLEKYGGHIGYSIRYSKWNKGYGTLQLKLLLQEAKKMGLDKILITCNDENIGSSKVITNNGGIYQDTIDNIINDVPTKTRRYWINIKEE